MRFGVDLTILGEYADPSLLLDLALEAEAAGWDGFFLWDHLMARRPLPVTDPWVVLAAVAARTERVRLGPMVTPLARRRMSKLARETVALDHLSGGRLILGVGLGELDEREFGAFGDEADRRLRARVLDESLAILAGLWSGRPIEFEGDHLQARTDGFLPVPRQQPRIPIWVAGRWPSVRPARRASAWDGYFPIEAGGGVDQQLSPAAMAEALAMVSDLRSGQGRFDLVHAGLSSGEREHDAELARRYAEAGVTWWLEHVHPERLGPAEARGLIRAGPPRSGEGTGGSRGAS